MIKYIVYLIVAFSFSMSISSSQADPCPEGGSPQRLSCIEKYNNAAKRYDQWIFRHQYYKHSELYTPSITVKSGDFGLVFKCDRGTIAMNFTSTAPFTDYKFTLQYDDEAPFDTSAVIQNKGHTLASVLDEWTIDKLVFAERLTLVAETNKKYEKITFNINNSLIAMTHLNCL